MKLTYQRLQEVLYLRPGETLFRRRIASDDEEVDAIAGYMFADIPEEETRLIVIDGEIYNDTKLKIFSNTGHYPGSAAKERQKKKSRPKSPVIGVVYLKKTKLWKATVFNRHRDQKDATICTSEDLGEAVLARLTYDICRGMIKRGNPRSAYRYAVDVLGMRIMP